MLFVKKRTNNAFIVSEFLIFSFKRTNVVVHLLYIEYIFEDILLKNCNIS